MAVGGLIHCPNSRSQRPRTRPATRIARSIRREQARLLEEALGRLVPEQRVALLLHAAHGFEYVEIAAATGVAMGTVKSRIHRGRLALRDLLVDHRDLFADVA